MKKSFKILSLLCVFLICSMALIACNPNKNTTLEGVTLPKATDNEAIVVIQIEETNYLTYVVAIDQLTKNSALDALQYLADNQELHLVTESSQYGAFVTEIATLKAGTNSFINLCTSVTTQWDTSAYFVEYNCGGVAVGTSGLGISSLTLEGKCVIYIQLQTF